MVHDLRAINALVQEAPITVPNPATALQTITPTHTHFTVIDLANAFYCLPLAQHLQQIFAFTFQGQQYTYSRMPQGFSLTPGIFNKILKEAPNTLLVQYVDDLLIASDSAETCRIDSLRLLHLLQDWGYGQG